MIPVWSVPLCPWDPPSHTLGPRLLGPQEGIQPRVLLTGTLYDWVILSL